MTFIFDMTMYDRQKRVIEMKALRNTPILNALATGEWPCEIKVVSYHTHNVKRFGFIRYHALDDIPIAIYYNGELDVDLHIYICD